jgi:hypothetical protein
MKHPNKRQKHLIRNRENTERVMASLDHTIERLEKMGDFHDMTPLPYPKPLTPLENWQQNDEHHVT